MVRVLPKLTCRHCNKTFSRKSTLDQHLVSHSSERWADVQVDQFFSSKIKSSPQDAAIKDLEQAIAFSGEPTFLDGRKNIGVNQQQLDRVPIWLEKVRWENEGVKTRFFYLWPNQSNQPNQQNQPNQNTLFCRFMSQQPFTSFLKSRSNECAF